VNSPQVECSHFPCSEVRNLCSRRQATAHSSSYMYTSFSLSVHFNLFIVAMVINGVTIILLRAGIDTQKTVRRLPPRRNDITGDGALFIVHLAKIADAHTVKSICLGLGLCNFRRGKWMIKAK